MARRLEETQRKNKNILRGTLCFRGFVSKKNYTPLRFEDSKKLKEKIQTFFVVLCVLVTLCQKKLYTTKV